MNALNRALENLEGGMTADDALTVGKMAAGAGVDVLDLSWPPVSC